MITNIRTLVESTRLGQKQAFAAREEITTPAGAQDTGFHIYGKLKTRIAFAATENDTETIRFLRVIHALAGVTVACAREMGDIEVLELQGEVIHVFVVASTPDSALDRVIEFSQLLTNAVYDQVCPLADDDVFGFSMAIDYGPTVFVANRSPSADSIVSLAPAANAPAKRLFAGVSAGNVAVPNWLVGKEGSGWHEVDVRKDEPFVKVAENLGINDPRLFTEGIASVASDVVTGITSVRRGSRAFLAENAERVWEGATVFRGFFFRADLHDFSKRIEAAWKLGEDAVRGEVVFFKGTMDETSSFLEKCRFFAVQLPWAGDCANILVKAKKESYEDSRQWLPAVFASEWHDKMTDDGDARQWLVGEAGGGDGNGTGEGNGGAVVVSPITIDDRRFVLAGGWSVRTSQTAQEIAGTREGDTVLPNSDFAALDDDIQGAFTNTHRDFWKASKTALAKLPSQARNALQYKAATPSVIGGVQRPQPRPFYDYRRVDGGK